MGSSECIFCKIVEGKIPSQKVRETGKVLVIRDIQPMSPTHYLFIPKEHFESVAHVPPDRMDIMADIFSEIQKVANEEGFAKDGFRTVINTGKGGGQTVFHLHVHLLAGKSMSGQFS
ncbi:MAG: histidine triad nucleotide-binding protein [Bdellovibrionales bacterium]|nr:histidine triad nucleotide-binding protein [Bdellovibrionales bacterium]